MSHEIANDEVGQARFVYNAQNGPPWHKLGQGVDGAMTKDEAMTRAGLDWITQKGPLLDPLGNQIPDYRQTFFIDKLGEKHHLGVVGSHWEPLQNDRFFELMDTIVGGGYGVWETAGALFDCKRVFASLDPSGVPGLILNLPNGEDLKTWLVGMNGHDGSTAFELFMTTIRPVCWNTIKAGRGIAKSQFRTIHTRGLEGRIEEIRDAMKIEVVALAGLHRDCVKLIETPTDMEIVDAWLSTIFEESDHAATAKRRTQARADVTRLAHEGRGNDGRTHWSWFNGYTEWLDGTMTKEAAAGDTDALGRRLVSSLAGPMHDRREYARRLLVEMSESAT